MHAGFGPIRQMGYVVRDIETAMNAWADRLRIGPWFYNPRLALSHYRFRGTDYPDFDMSYALTNSGDMQIELIQQRCDTPSLYREHLDRHGEGLQHICVWPADYDACFALAETSGLTVAQEGRFGRIRFAYFEDAAHGGTSLEISELVPGRLPGIGRIRAAALDWDGSEPIRPYP
ncbi:VOC family protein [Rhizorhabdus dicambivorans]|uniref:Glyoxalase n=1 Tax=Rhizorhabdus dicambivorans TaxID=1850238 RepID=A0A2A4FR18_9SPHN|nr:VOC family protein [Rhizorhabdus dicambivorans]ATE63970.1 glyoxalase [Rhizorhabdus dicambivorans]PCE40170.1 glyoxalase [Rhizorhabdus dicambivorans]